MKPYIVFIFLIISPLICVDARWNSLSGSDDETESTTTSEATISEAIVDLRNDNKRSIDDVETPPDDNKLSDNLWSTTRSPAESLEVSPSNEDGIFKPMRQLERDHLDAASDTAKRNVIYPPPYGASLPYRPNAYEYSYSLPNPPSYGQAYQPQAQYAPPSYSQNYSQPSYPQSNYEQSNYAESLYSQPNYGQPQYGQPQYGQPQYGQPQYGQPQYGQPSYAPPSYSPPGYQPSYGAANYSSYSPPSYSAPSYGAPSYGAPSYGAPSYSSSYAPSYGQNYIQDSYGQPSYGQPSYGQPSYGAPSYSSPYAPSYGQNYTQDSYGQPSYGQSSYGQPSYGQPSYGQPSYSQPSYSQPSYGQPSYSQPSYGPSSASPPSYQAPYPQAYIPSYDTVSQYMTPVQYNQYTNLISSVSGNKPYKSYNNYSSNSYGPNVFTMKVAVAVLTSHFPSEDKHFKFDKFITGNIFFTEIMKDIVLISGFINGLTPGDHAAHIHEFGDLTHGCESVGGHFNPLNKPHGNINAIPSHLGDLGNIHTNKLGVTYVNKLAKGISLSGYDYSIVGRALVIHQLADDLGGIKEVMKSDIVDSEMLVDKLSRRSLSANIVDEKLMSDVKILSLKTGNAGSRVACGIIGLANVAPTKTLHIGH